MATGNWQLATGNCFRVLLAAAVCLALAWGAQSRRGATAAATTNDGLGIAPGKIKHVWLIILENKSYDATFTGLNHNTYLWQTLPAQGILLRQYYGTGHSSQDNYISLVSGQATQPDVQSDCPQYSDFGGHVDLSGTLATNPNYGQMTSSQGPNGRPGTNGCVYPREVPTLFNQLDAAHVTWKGYAQDLGNQDTASPGARGSAPILQHDAGPCGAPWAQPAPQGSTQEPNPGGANPTDQYVPKHFPFPWFKSLLESGDCNPAHIANLFDPNNGLLHDLQSEATTPAFSWITPNNCSDAHDAVCAGNNLSGGWADANTPNPPVNYAGGLYAADLFLEHVIPAIEASPAFKDGGLIDITFDEAFPPFMYEGSINAPGHHPTAAYNITFDAAGETLHGRTVHTEPTGPNTPLLAGNSGAQLYPGPGDNAFIDRPNSCLAWRDVPAGTKPPPGACLLGGGGHPAAERKHATATAAAESPLIADDAIQANDRGKPVSGDGIPAGAFVGEVIQTPLQPATPRAPRERSWFALVDAGGSPLLTTAAVHGIVLGGFTEQTDPLMDVNDPTPGGGDTGSVLISPYIKPGSVSDVAYNHYSWLRTMEDLFRVAPASPGLDRQGHIGYAAQIGLAPFGRDVFNNPAGSTAIVPSSASVGQIVSASPQHPQLIVQGESAQVTLGAARLLVTAVGPRVPEEGAVPVPATSPCSFDVTLRATVGDVNLASGQFTITDEFGRLHHPRVTGINGAPLPHTLRAGQTLRLSVRDVLPTGNGRLHWAPQGATPVIAWDFDVEID